MCNDPDATPTRVRAYVNRDGLDFEAAAAAAPTQEWQLVAGPAGATVEYPCKASRFQNVRSVDLHFPDAGAAGGAAARIDFVGFKGSHAEAKREAVHAVYEARPVPGYHKVGGEVGGGRAGVS